MFFQTRRFQSLIVLHPTDDSETKGANTKFWGVHYVEYAGQEVKIFTITLVSLIGREIDIFGCGPSSVSFIVTASIVCKP